MQGWDVLDSHYLLRRKWMDIREDRVRLPNGTIIDEFHVVEYPEWVCVLPITDDDRFVLVEQYRHGVRRASVEFPAGVVEAGEDYLLAARRELLEETGYGTTRECEYVGRCAPEPSRHSNFAHVVLARGVRPEREPAPDDNEVLRVLTWPVGDLKGLIRSERFVHGVHYAAVLMTYLKGFIKL